MCPKTHDLLFLLSGRFDCLWNTDVHIIRSLVFHGTSRWETPAASHGVVLRIFNSKIRKRTLKFNVCTNYELKLSMDDEGNARERRRKWKLGGRTKNAENFKTIKRSVVFCATSSVSSSPCHGKGKVTFTEFLFSSRLLGLSRVKKRVGI